MSHRELGGAWRRMASLELHLAGLDGRELQLSLAPDARGEELQRAARRGGERVNGGPAGVGGGL